MLQNFNREKGNLKIIKQQSLKELEKMVTHALTMLFQGMTKPVSL